MHVVAKRFTILTLAGTAALTGCMDRPLAVIEVRPAIQGEVEFPVEANRNLDILFVIDDSRSMGNEQDSLATNFERLIAEIQSIEHGLPDLHIGVVSTDLGIGPYTLPGDGCTATGKMGLLQNSPLEGETCPVPADRFIRDIEGKEGQRLRNYEGTLAETFSCIARLGDEGCGYEQPLEAMRRALSAEHDSGFLRERTIGECDRLDDPTASSHLPCYTLAQAPETCGAGDPLWIRAHYAAGEIVPPTTIIRARCESN